MDQLILPLLQPPTPSFGNFVPGRNAEALGAVRDLADGRSQHSVVYLWGPPGSGRSHLLRAASEHAGIEGKVGLAVADDVDGLDADAQQQLFSATLRALGGQGSVLVCGDLPPVSLRLREDLRTRLAAGLVFRLTPLDDEEKVHALRARAAHLGLGLGDDVIGYMLRHCPRDMGSLFSLLDGLDRLSVQRHRPISVSLLRECLDDGCRP